MVNFYTGNDPTPGFSELELYRQYKVEQKKKHGSVSKKRPDTTVSADNSYDHLNDYDDDEAMLDADAPVSNILEKPAPSNRKITIRDYHLWKATGIKTFDEYLNQKPHKDVELPKRRPVKNLPGLPGGADDPNYLESVKEQEEEHLRRVRKYGRRELMWPSHLL
ncbi:hypothetical protein HBI56_059910 [Parastagonospora nodorum]|nr:hypothetical protein HBH82_173560 [Parastagonospora nodorum]KAH4662105.1 hypothetical protein HBH80_130960 [Parastagonospora nodorum]KAH5097858.1 hypothetical protein HBH72_122230 [Parastagonospora nodorum]KAH5179829.1 hypothetical protein HBH77_190580 [Parastagonospora nodorum]KAH5876398.1 hypothetical protein HBI92_159350 [Parastagonospora nodorum]